MSESSSPHCRLVLLGQVGAGKSATGNTILGQQIFQTKRSLRAVTQDVQCGKVSINGLCVEVYDTPGFLGPGVQSGDTERKCQTLIDLATSVPTVFLLVISTDRFTEQEKKAADLVLDFLGHNNLQNTSIIFTKGDELQDCDITIEQFMEESEELKELVEKLNRRYHVINNKQSPRNRNEVIGQIMNTNMIISQNQLSYAEQTEEENLEVEDDIYRDQGCSSDPAAMSRVMDAHSHTRDLRLLLIGKTGSGVSASGNTILGRKEFTSKINFSSTTKTCKNHTAEVSDRTVTVFDLPTYFNTLNIDLVSEIKKGLKMVSSGIHAILLVFSLHTFTQQDVEVVSLFKQKFGKNARKHTLVLFTHGDQLPKPLDQLISENPELSKIIQECGGRFHLLDNKDLNNRDQVPELLRKIEQMVSENENRCYTLQMFEIQSRNLFMLSFFKGNLFNVFFLLAMGYVNMRNEGSSDIKTFLHGCAGGVLSAVAGAAPAAIGTLICKNHRWRNRRVDEEFLKHVKLLAIMCGFGAGMISGYFWGPVGLSATLRGIQGGIESYITFDSALNLL